MRLWNLESRTCVFIMSGVKGHRNEVLSLVGVEGCGLLKASIWDENHHTLFKLLEVRTYPLRISTLGTGIGSSPAVWTIWSKCGAWRSTCLF